MSEELLDIYDASGRCIGAAPRSECHGNPELLHHTAHVFVFHPVTGAILLQKRSTNKHIQPGKWDTSVGGHLAPGEDYETGARRELAEELGVTGQIELKYLFDSSIRNEIESEDAQVFGLWQADGFKFQDSEIDAIRFWSAEELFNPENRKEFTPNLCAELEELKKRGLI